MQEQNDYDAIAQVFDPAKLTREYLFSQDLKNLLLGVTDDDTRQYIIMTCQDKAAEFRKSTDWKEWFKQFARDIRRAKVRTLSNMPDEEVQGYEFGDYSIDDRGLHYYDTNMDCYRDFCKGTPLVVSRIYENIDREPEKIELTFKLRGRWKRITCERLTVSDARKAVLLAESGISIDSLTSSLFVGYVTDFIAMNASKIDVVPSVGRLGWFGDEFIPYDKKYAYDGYAGNRERYEAVWCKGSDEEWIKECNRIRINPVVRMTVAASFASPLLVKLNAQMFILHLWGTTEAGKSVALMLALSIWGQADKLMQTFNATAVGLERLAIFYKHLPLALDELQTIKDKYNSTDKLIYSVCGGIGKVRGNKLGGNDEQPEWRNVIISTGEQPLTDDNSGGGAKNRAIELHCEGRLFDNVQQTLEVMRSHYGGVGKRFINEFIKPLLADGRLIKAYKYICAELTKYSFTDKQRNSIAVMCLADTGFNILFGGMDLPEAMVDSLNFYRIHANMFADKEDIKIGKRSYDDFLSWVTQNSNKFSEQSDTEIYGKREKGYICILSTALDKWCYESGFSKRAVLAEWREKGFIMGNPANKFRSKCEINKERVNCYRIRTEERQVGLEATNEEILKNLF